MKTSSVVLLILGLFLNIGCGGAAEQSQASLSAAAAGTEYYMVMFALEGRFNEGTKSHTFATFIESSSTRITEDTISYMPALDQLTIDGRAPAMRAVQGKTYGLEDTFGMINAPKVFRWGPYKITEQLYRNAMTQIQYLNSSMSKYYLTAQLHGITDWRVKAFQRQDGGILNCVTAVSDLAGLFDIDGRIGLVNRNRPWGSNASRQILGRLVSQGQVNGLVTYPDIERRLRFPERFNTRAWLQ